MKHKISNELLKISYSQDINEALKEYTLIDIINIKDIGCDNKYRCLCHGLLKNKLCLIKNNKTFITSYIGVDCLKLFSLNKLNKINYIKLLKNNPTKSKIDINFKLIDNLKLASKLANKKNLEIENNILCEEVINKLGSDKITFGKYKGKSVYKMLNINKSYLKYFILSDKFQIVSDIKFMFED